MVESQLPEDESGRLAALAKYRIDQAAEPNAAFLDLLAQVVRLCGTSAAGLTLVECDHAFHFARLGLPVERVARQDSPCAQTILGQDLFCVHDLAADPRFVGHPALTQDPPLVSYAGLPLLSPTGQPIGTLCLMHHEPFSLSAEQVGQLRELAREANRLLDYFHLLRQPVDAEPLLSLLMVFPDPVVVVDEEGSIRQLNAEAEQLLGYSRRELLGQSVEALLPPSSREAHAEHRRRFFENPYPRSMGGREFLIYNKAGERLYVEVTLLPVEGAERQVVLLLRNVTKGITSQRTLMHISQRTFWKTQGDFFTSLASELSEELGATFVTIGRHVDAADSIETLAFVRRGELQENFSYSLAGTPCETTLGQEICVLRHGLRESYPDDPFLRDHTLEVYVGVRLFSSRGEVIGLINVLYDRPVSRRHAELTLSLLEIVGLRAASELERMQAEMKLRTLSLSVERSPNAVLITDRNAVIQYVNPQFCRMSGYSEAECIGAPASLAGSGRTPEETYAEMWCNILAGREWQGELLNRKKDGELYWAHTRIFPLTDEAGRIMNFVSIQDDVSQARKLTRRLEYEATHDQLTDLVNRREFERRLEQAIQNAGEQDTSHCVCFLDLDQFKVLNDTSGHVAGDEVLKKIGQVLRQEVRAHDTAARLGGDEFGLLLMNCPLRKAMEICEKVRAAIRAIRFKWEDRVHTLGTSIGIARISGDTNVLELMKRVDAACYSAKDQGRNRIHVYQDDDEFTQRDRRDIDWVPQVTAAMAEGRVQLYVQPIVPTQEAGAGRDLSYEVLMRLLTPDARLLTPSQFLPAVQRYDLSTRLDRYMLDRFFEWVAAHPGAMEEMNSLALNLSASAIGDPEFLDYLLMQLRAPGIPSAKLRFELSESAVMANLHDAREFMQAVRSTGAQIALDNFGSGLSSVTYLKNLPMDVLKIDGLLVRGIAGDQAGFIMVKMINELAHSLGIHTVAEYVENDAILSRLQELGVDFVQGHGVANPAPIDEVLGALV